MSIKYHSISFFKRRKGSGITEGFLYARIILKVLSNNACLIYLKGLFTLGLELNCNAIYKREVLFSISLVLKIQVPVY